MRPGIRTIMAVIGLSVIAQAHKAEAQQNKSANANQCEEHLKAHGLLTRAYNQCHFTFYSRGFTIQADDCSKKLGEPASRQLVVQGTTAFDERAKQMGLSTLCAKIIKDFPYTVRQ